MSMIAPWDDGYIVEVSRSAKDGLLHRLTNPSDEIKATVSRIVDLLPHPEVVSVLDKLKAVWDAAPEIQARRSFVLSPAPFRHNLARRRIIAALHGAGLGLSPAFPLLEDHSVLRNRGPFVELYEVQAATLPASMPERALALQTPGHYLRFAVTLGSFEEMLQASANGISVRWDPIPQLEPARTGWGPEPEIEVAITGTEPTVGVIDGGLSARRYEPIVAWREEPFFPEGQLDVRHGNRVAALIWNPEEWSNGLQLDPLPCRVGIVPAVPRSDIAAQWDIAAFFEYLDRVISRHPDTKVWNVSANLRRACDENRVSEFGHQLSVLSRKYGVLFVVSAGNKEGGQSGRIAPPADAEAGITVAGRAADVVGAPGGPCAVSRQGLGPEEMLKPDLSWFSTHRLLGGDHATATSYAAPLISRLAAHTWSKLRDPSPSMVKALLLSTADRDRLHEMLGFGSPVVPRRPWATPEHRVALCWRGSMTEKGEYTWSDIRLPPSIAQDGWLRGHIRLVAVLEPVTHMRGSNYFSTRLEAQVEYFADDGDWKKLFGGLPPETAEARARLEDHKWDPVRFYSERNVEAQLGRPELRVSARLYWRDRYLYPFSTQNREVPVSFVLTLEAPDRTADIHDDFVATMSAGVEIEVAELDVEADGH
ncbi:S8 family serine peptidase [Nitrospirillum pindoramense]|nr:S8 family serine peptidase [Nitrospirillum amazonense]